MQVNAYFIHLLLNCIF